MPNPPGSRNRAHSIEPSSLRWSFYWCPGNRATTTEPVSTLDTLVLDGGFDDHQHRKSSGKFSLKLHTRPTGSSATFHSPAAAVALPPPLAPGLFCYATPPPMLQINSYTQALGDVPPSIELALLVQPRYANKPTPGATTNEDVASSNSRNSRSDNWGGEKKKEVSCGWSGRRKRAGESMR